MRRVALLALLLAASAREASANQCTSLRPPLPYGELPLGCPLVVYMNPFVSQTPPHVQVERGGFVDELEATMSVETVELDVWYETIDEICVEWSGTKREPYERYTIDMGNAELGDRVFLEAGSVTIVPAAACPADAPVLYCRDPIQDYTACEPIDHDPHAGHDHGTGCSTGGGVEFALVGLLLGLRRRAISRR